MIHFSKKITIYLISSIFFIFTLNATSSFSGFTGLKINYSANNRSALVRLSAICGISPRIEIRSADAACNPYIAFKLILAAGIEGIKNGDSSLYESYSENLPENMETALELSRSSEFVYANLPEKVTDIFFRNLEKQLDIMKNYNDIRSFSDDYYFPYI